VTDATTWETVTVLVIVAVEVRVVVEDVSCAMARRGRRRRDVIVDRCIVIFVMVRREQVFEFAMKMRPRDWIVDEI